MKTRLAILMLSICCAASCSNAHDRNSKTLNEPGSLKIVSLDFCADQYVLKFVDKKDILALSQDAESSFSYMRKQAKGIAKVRPRAEDVLLLHPDVVVRSYGGGPNAVSFFENVGIKVVQIGYANDLESVKQVILDTADGLGAPEKGQELVHEMEQRLASIPKNENKKTALYMTSKGAVAGKYTQIDELLELAGLENFQASSGWGAISLERLAYEKPDIIAASFFETSDVVSDIWTPARHPIAKKALNDIPVIDLPGAWTACGAWFLVDAVEALAKGAPEND